uniref:Uncharacterized protein n=1 Tax=Ascaris lumbricoides TaxID=6252 RepID=A0A0M3HSN0_ASCLU
MVVPSEGFDISNAGSCLGLAAQGRNSAIPEVSSCMPLLAACFRVVGKVAERYRSDVTLRQWGADAWGQHRSSKNTADSMLTIPSSYKDRVQKMPNAGEQRRDGTGRKNAKQE